MIISTEAEKACNPIQYWFFKILTKIGTDGQYIKKYAET